jgi:serine/threonine-protein kinase HipA
VTTDLGGLRFTAAADVYKGGVIAATLERGHDGTIAFRYRADYLDRPDARPAASTLPLAADPVITQAGALPPFFAGLLPEGRRLGVLKEAVKTSLGDELTLLLAVGADVPGDVQVVPKGEEPDEPEPAVEVRTIATLDLLEFADAVDRHGIPGVQDKLSAQMISTPVSLEEGRFILKLDPAAYPHLVRNERMHLQAARGLSLSVAEAQLVHDARNADALLVTRFDRVRTEGRWERRAVEDATQVLGLPPAEKYRIEAEQVVRGLAALCAAPLVAVRNLYLQFVFAWLTGNGDLHGKNVAVLSDGAGRWNVAPIYDIPSTLLYGDDSLALPVAGRTRGLKARHWAAFAADIGLPERAAASANALALTAAGRVDLAALPFEGPPLNGAVRELGFRRAELG